jgi:hypothetical protein
MYAIVLGILMIIELAGFIMAFAYKGKLKDVYDTTLTKVFDTGLESNKTEIIKAFQDLEDVVKCCGVHGKSDYDRFNYTSLSEACKQYPTKGCSQAIIDFLDTNLPIIGGILGGVLALEFFGLIFAIVLAVALKHAPDTDSYSSNPGDVIKGAMPGRRRNY